MRIAERELELVLTLRLRAVTDADDLELAGVSLGDSDDHVGDEGTRQAVTRTLVALVVAALEHERRLVLADRDTPGKFARQGALGPLDGERLTGEVHLHSGGNRDDCFTYA